MKGFPDRKDFPLVLQVLNEAFASQVRVFYLSTINNHIMRDGLPLARE